MRTDPASLSDLLVASAAKDKAAFRELYARAAPRLLGIGMRMLGRRELAEDVLQDVFVTAWQTAPRFDPARGSAEAWLATIMRRRAIDRLRASPWLAREVDLEHAPVETVGTIGSEAAHAVRQCLERLAQNERNALMLAFYYGFSHSELSKRLAAPLGTVKSWVRRGLASMKACLGE